MFDEEDYNYWMRRLVIHLATRMRTNYPSLQDIKTHQQVRFTPGVKSDDEEGSNKPRARDGAVVRRDRCLFLKVPGAEPSELIRLYQLIDPSNYDLDPCYESDRNLQIERLQAQTEWRMKKVRGQCHVTYKQSGRDYLISTDESLWDSLTDTERDQDSDVWMVTVVDGQPGEVVKNRGKLVARKNDWI